MPELSLPYNLLNTQGIRVLQNTLGNIHTGFSPPPIVAGLELTGMTD